MPERKLRKECVQEIRGHRHGERYKSRVLAGVLKAFLRWYLGKEEEEIIFEAGDGTELRVDAPNSYSDDYGRQWYERLKDTERALVYDAPKPHTAMLSLRRPPPTGTVGPGRPATTSRDCKRRGPTTLARRSSGRFRTPGLLSGTTRRNTPTAARLTRM